MYRFVDAAVVRAAACWLGTDFPPWSDLTGDTDEQGRGLQRLPDDLGTGGNQHHGHTEGVLGGLASTCGVITSAGLVLAATFATGFMVGPLPRG